MKYENFKQLATSNREFTSIPTTVQLYAEGVSLSENGHMLYYGKTYITNLVKIAELPEKIQPLFLVDKFAITKPSTDIAQADDKPIALKIDSNLVGLSEILVNQLKKIVEPGEETDMKQEIQKSNAICNVADKLISIVDVSLKIETAHTRRRR
ncbi:MAG: hypothetical protein KU29_04435 [Sulfurovum sp. FS06-10]|nr:MAG: hypothetical protein KU29_04435 [Sulfurovum sp. FS06-10]